MLIQFGRGDWVFSIENSSAHYDDVHPLLSDHLCWTVVLLTQLVTTATQLDTCNSGYTYYTSSVFTSPSGLSKIDPVGKGNVLGISCLHVTVTKLIGG